MNRNLVPSLLSVWGVALCAVGLSAADPRPFRVAPVLADRVELPSPASVQLDGFLGARTRVNAKDRLAAVDLEPLLAGFRQKPGVHPWIGEHIGKWMHAATLAWAQTGDAALRTKLDYAAAELGKAQEADGYLGTYVPEKRFGRFEGSDWDVWSHKYNLIGLLTYYQYTGNDAALQTSRRIGDLLINTFGPGKKSLLAAGTHVGMASTSVLEPMVLLYRCTDDARYLDFARSIVSSWDEPNGPAILKTLLATRNVQKTANAKAYEMLSNLVGLCELARVTGTREYLQAALYAWDDVVAHRLYITGSASQGEHFRDDYHLPNHEGAHVGETCVTTTWIQLNSQLLRLTGEARFGHELEKTFYNHLAAAQRPDGAQWCYFTALEGRKPYGPGINCCVSSGPRGMALVPQHAWLLFREQEREGVAVNLFETSRLRTTLNGAPVTLELKSEFPARGTATLAFGLRQPAQFALRFREPSWAAPLQVSYQGAALPLSKDASGWTTIPARQWQDGDQLSLQFTLAGRMVVGELSNRDKAALLWGPFVLAYDDKRNPALPNSRQVGLLAQGDQPVLLPRPGESLSFQGQVRAAQRQEPFPAAFVPFAEAGRDGGAYRVWLRAPGVEFARNASLLSAGEESRSREGNVEGSINDGDTGTYVVTFNGRRAAEDWYAVTLDEPATIARVGFTHGKTFHDGGWFDTSAGKPRIQVQRTRGGRWETVGYLTNYPATTATSPAGLAQEPAATFSVALSRPVQAVALRVAGTPACGDNPQQAFSSCAELSAAAE